MSNPINRPRQQRLRVVGPDVPVLLWRMRANHIQDGPADAVPILLTATPNLVPNISDREYLEALVRLA